MGPGNWPRRAGARSRDGPAASRLTGIFKDSGQAAPPGSAGKHGPAANSFEYK